jgi:hypothetical protein
MVTLCKHIRFVHCHEQTALDAAVSGALYRRCSRVAHLVLYLHVDVRDARRRPR